MEIRKANLKKNVTEVSVKDGIIREILKTTTINFPRRKVITYRIIYLWKADLVYMYSGNVKGICKVNKCYEFFLTAIVIFSNCACIITFKVKTGLNITKACELILRGNYPKSL